MDTLFPCYGAKASIHPQFRRGEKLHQKANAHRGQPISGKCIVKAIDCYEAALDDGAFEAAVNLLNIVVPVMMQDKAKHPDRPAPFPEKAQRYIEMLEDAHYPEGQYYRALCLLYGLFETGNTPDGDIEIALLVLDRLATKGYAYAQMYLDFLFEYSGG